MRLDEYLKEPNTYGKGISFFDIDETLFHTFARVHVKKDNKVVKILSNGEYNSYKAQDGETFDFSEFRDAKLFYDTSEPIEKMIKTAIDVIRKGEKRGSKAILITARADFDDKNIFLDTFRKEGFPIDKVYVERAGNRTGATIPVLKKNIILEYLSTGIYRRARIFDDYIKTCKEFLKLKNEVPGHIIERIAKTYNLGNMPREEILTFNAYHVREKDGTVVEIV